VTAEVHTVAGEVVVAGRHRHDVAGGGVLDRFAERAVADGQRLALAVVTVVHGVDRHVAFATAGNARSASASPTRVTTRLI
jgi:hypothetical protein